MTSRDTPLTVALVGAGMISKHHLTAWAGLQPYTRIVSVCDPELSSAERRAQEFGIGSVCQTADELFAAHCLDAIDVASPRQTHETWIRAAASRGVAVLVQKPLTPTLRDAEALLRDIGGKARVMVHENWRFHPIYRELKAWIEADELGQIQMVRGSYLSSAFLSDGFSEPPGFARQPFLRHETRLFMAEAFIHHIDVVRFLCGSLRLISARTTRSLSDVPGETLAALFLETADGAPVDLVGNMAAPGHPSKGIDEFDLIGSKASARVRGADLQLLGGNSRRVSLDVEQSYQSCFNNAIGHFVESLRSGERFETDMFDNIETLRLVEHAYWAAGHHPRMHR